MTCPEVYVVIYVVNNPCSYYIDTCSKKIQSEKLFKSKLCSAPHSKIGNFSCESWRRLLTKEKQDALA